MPSAISLELYNLLAQSRSLFTACTFVELTWISYSRGLCPPLLSAVKPAKNKLLHQMGVVCRCRRCPRLQLHLRAEDQRKPDYFFHSSVVALRFCPDRELYSSQARHSRLQGAYLSSKEPKPMLFCAIGIYCAWRAILHWKRTPPSPQHAHKFSRRSRGGGKPTHSPDRAHLCCWEQKFLLLQGKITDRSNPRTGFQTTVVYNRWRSGRKWNNSFFVSSSCTVEVGRRRIFKIHPPRNVKNALSTSIGLWSVYRRHYMTIFYGYIGNDHSFWRYITVGNKRKPLYHCNPSAAFNNDFFSVGFWSIQWRTSDQRIRSPVQLLHR